MGAIIYGASLWQNDSDNGATIRYDTLGKDSEVFAVGDPVAITSGVLLVGGVNTPGIVGVAVKAATMGATNDTVYPGYQPTYTDRIWLMGTDSDLTDNETDGGTYYALKGTTGAVQVNVSLGVTTGSNRVVEIVKVDPYNIGGTGSGSGKRQVLVRFVKTPYTNVQITS